MRWKDFLSTTVVALTSVVYCAYRWKSNPKRLTSLPSTGEMISRHKVQNIQWDGMEPFPHLTAKLGLPYIVKGTSIDRWRAHNRWNLHHTYLQKSVGNSHVSAYVLEDGTSTFGPYFDETKPLFGVDSVSRRHKYAEVSMEFSDFLEHVKRDRPSRKKLYLSQEIERLHLLERDIQPLEDLLLLNPSHSSINIWMGEKGVVSPCHYDGYHNIYVQIFGKKRFVLAMPNASHTLQPFPFLHPSHAQCQNLLALVENNATNKVGVYEANLNPGDVLYIPPLWYHEVYTLETSISVNGWTQGHEVNQVSKLFNLPLPDFVSPTGYISKVLGTSWIIYSVIMKSKWVASDFLSDLFFERYYRLLEEDELKRRQLKIPIACMDGVGDSVDRMKAHKPRKLAKFAKSAASIVMSFQKSTSFTWLANWVEAVVLTSLGDVSFVASFLESVLPKCVKRIESFKA